MTGLAPVDTVDVRVLVDNVTDFALLRGACLCCAAHGLSCLLTLRRGDSVHTVLFDAGPEDRTFEQRTRATAFRA